MCYSYLLSSVAVVEGGFSELICLLTLFYCFVGCSYVQASYARFLWDSEEDEEEEEEKEVKEGTNRAQAPKLVHGVPSSPPPLAAAA